jgi:aminoglycoside phosphotransferase (APT) family kinase protein
MPEAWAVEVSSLAPPGGQGVSNETLTFDLTWHDRAGTHQRELVLRIHPSSFQLFMEPRFREQFELMGALNRAALVKAPMPLWFEEDPSVLGQPFFVMERVGGRVPISSPVYNATGWLFDAAPGERRRLWVSAVCELSRIHRVPMTALSWLTDAQPATDGLRHELEVARRSLDWSTGGNPPDFLLGVHDWLERQFPAGHPQGLSWGDARIGNMLFDQSFEVTAVLDWEQSSLAGPLTDLGWWLLFDELHASEPGIHRLDGLGSRRETIELWQELTGLRAPDLAWYDVFAAYHLLQIACRARLLLGAPMRNASSEQWLVARIADVTGLGAPANHRVSD